MADTHDVNTCIVANEPVSNLDISLTQKKDKKCETPYAKGITIELNDK
jgi:hypothetical protein